MPENAKNPLRVNAFPPPQATTVVDLYEYRGDLNRLICQICEMTPAQLRTARFNADATAAVKAQRDDLRSIIQDFLRLARAELADSTQCGQRRRSITSKSGSGNFLTPLTTNANGRTCRPKKPRPNREHDISFAGKWGYSFDEQIYHGAFAAKGQAIAEGMNEPDERSLFSRPVPIPSRPKTLSTVGT